MSPDPPGSPAPSELEGIEIAPGVFAPESAMRFAFARSSGPGGQNVNKLNTKAELWVSLPALRGLSPDALQRLVQIAGRRITKENELHITAETARSQERNREAVLDKLRELLVRARHRPKPRRATRPSRASRMRRLNEKRRRSEVKSKRGGHSPKTDD